LYQAPKEVTISLHYLPKTNVKQLTLQPFSVTMVKQNWWKYLGALLVLYSLVAGLFIPLGPGVMGVSPSQLQQGQTNTVLITGHGTHFKDNQATLQAWVKNGATTLCATKIEVKDNQNFIATFDVAALNTKEPVHLILNDDVDGNVALDNAFWFNAAENGGQITQTTDCKITYTNKEAAGSSFPFLKILFQTIRNLFFHVPMWFSMIALLVGALVYSIKYLRHGKREHDIAASQITTTAMFLGVLGVLTGMTWANFTWGEAWPNDPKLNSVAIGMLMYLAYFILRGAIDDEEKRARVSAVTNVFFFPIFISLVFVLPRLTDSLHPGNGGNPGFNSYDLDDTMRMVFYPAVLGWILIGYWIAQLKIRVKKLEVSDDE
jgi:heme exporter protein C